MGQPEISGEVAPLPAPAVDAGDPDWIAAEPQFILNGTEMLQQGEVPIQRINELLPQLADAGCILLLTDFEPTPILDTMRQAKRRVYHKTHPDDARQHLTYIAK